MQQIRLDAMEHAILPQTTLTAIVRDEKMPQKIDRSKIRETLESAAINTHQKYPNFQGVIVFGSFTTDKENPSDIDLVPVLETYNGCWHFSPICEGENEFEKDYYQYKEIEKAFGDYFKEAVNGNRPVFKTREFKDGIIHIESLVALDDMQSLKKCLEHYRARPENFIGTEEATQIIKGFYRKSDSK